MPQLHNLSAGLPSAVDDGTDALGDFPQRVGIEIGHNGLWSLSECVRAASHDRQRCATRSRYGHYADSKNNPSTSVKCYFL